MLLGLEVVVDHAHLVERAQNESVRNDDRLMKRETLKAHHFGLVLGRAVDAVVLERLEVVLHLVGLGEVALADAQVGDGAVALLDLLLRTQRD